jgi:uncharacterized membrane protein YeaQ/YmgE (transglycosylase-associated protein family)
MIDEIAYGILGGLFGSSIVKWLRRYKYRTIFFASVIGTNIYVFVEFAKLKGWREAARIMAEGATTYLGIFLPISVGLIAVFCVFICSLGIPKKKK